MKKIHVIYTGGTIGGNFSVEEECIDADIKSRQFMKMLSKHFPDLFKYAIITHESPIKKFSENIVPNDWSIIAKSVHVACLNGCDGIIIAHGTDTMPFTASAVSYMLQGLKIPVIFTGSNYPFKYRNSDAPQNLSDAFRVAMDGRFGGIYVVFSGMQNISSTIHLGTRVRKVRFYDNCFSSINADPIGVIKKKFLSTDYRIDVTNSNLFNIIKSTVCAKELSLSADYDDNVMLVKIYPGFDPERLLAGIIARPPRGIILELYNSGTGCIDGKYSLLSMINTASSKYKIPIFVTSQSEGVVEMNTYISSKRLREAGAFPLRDMITEAAMPKLMWVLGHYKSRDEIISAMINSIAGEVEIG